MLLIVTLVLVLVAAVTLVMGIFGNHVQPIYISIVCSFAAAILLGVISRLSRRKPSDVTTADAPAPLPADEPESARAEGNPSGQPRVGPTAQLAAVGPDGSPVSETTGGPGPRDEHWAHQQQWARRQQWAQPEDGQRETAGPEAAPAAPTTRYEPANAGIFPIEDYDDLRLGEIVPLLDGLDEGELTEVRDREYGGQRRSAVLDRIDARLGQRPRAAQPEPASVPEPPAAWPAAGAVLGSAKEPQPQPQPAAPWREAGAVVGTAASAATSGPAPGAIAAERHEPHDGADATSPARHPGGAEGPSDNQPPFPIENYDDLRVAQILILVTHLDGGELERVAAHERQGYNRNTILNRIDRLLRAGPPASRKDAAPA